MIKIPVHKSFNLIMIDMFFLDLNSKKYKKALIAVDTGASTTVISSEVLSKLGYDLTKEDPIVKIYNVQPIK